MSLTRNGFMGWGRGNEDAEGVLVSAHRPPPACGLIKDLIKRAPSLQSHRLTGVVERVCWGKGHVAARRSQSASPAGDGAPASPGSGITSACPRSALSIDFHGSAVNLSVLRASVLQEEGRGKQLFPASLARCPGGPWSSVSQPRDITVMFGLGQTYF